MQSSQYLMNSELEVRTRLDTQNELLRNLEASAGFESGRATMAEEKYMMSEMHSTRLLRAGKKTLSSCR